MLHVYRALQQKETIIRQKREVMYKMPQNQEA